jgi:hypothetical protein
METEEQSNQSSHSSPLPASGDGSSLSALQQQQQDEAGEQPLFTIGDDDHKDKLLLAEELLSFEQVSHIMREQDADLLERMHYAASQVSQYSPGVTPDLKPMDRSLPIDIEDDPLILSSPRHHNSSALSSADITNSSGDIPSQPDFQLASFQELGRSSSSPQFSADASITASSSPILNRLGASSHHSRPSGGAMLDMVKELDNVTSWDKESYRDQGDLKEEALSASTTSSSSSRYRRLLSGEIRSVEQPAADDLNPTTVEENVEQEEETTASPISVAREAAAAALEQQQKKETGLAEQRRFREAMQFAEAVGENIGINRDDLHIIEDHTDDGESSDDDDDDACKSKEIVVDDPEALHDALSAPQTNLDTLKSSHGANLQDAQEGTIATPLPSHVDVPPQPELIVRRISKRPLWPFGPAGSDYDRFLDHVSDGLNRTNFVYKGICANPPEITKRGIQRGNYAQLHRKAWLEVSDKYHRYGKNLRLYYRYWERLGFPTNQFFDWLDSKGDAAGRPLPILEECPRSILDSDTVLYISNPEVTEGYALDIVCNEEGKGRIIDVDSRPVMTGQDGWIFVVRDSVMYGAEKITSISRHSKQRFHHSSFFGGKAVAAAGIIITDDQGNLTRLYPHSGHYRPSESHMQRMLFFLHRKGVDLRTFEMDTQQFRHVSRDKDATKPRDGDKHKDKTTVEAKDSEKKMKKVDSLHMEKAVNVACFLAHKASFIGNGFFDSIHKIRRADVTSVSEALDLVDNGGFWKRPKAVEENQEEQVPAESIVECEA